MEEKVFGLLEKLYIEMQYMKGNMATKEDLEELRETIATKQDIVRLEDKMDSNHKALYDGYKQSIEGITEVKNKLEELTDRVENQEIRLQVLKSVK